MAPEQCSGVVFVAEKQIQARMRGQVSVHVGIIRKQPIRYSAGCNWARRFRPHLFLGVTKINLHQV